LGRVELESGTEALVWVIGIGVIVVGMFIAGNGGGHHLFESGFKEIIRVDACIINDFEGTLILFIISGEVQFSSSGGGHGVSVDVALDVVMEIIVGECTWVTSEERIGRLQEHNPVVNRLCALRGTEDQEFDLLFPSWV
jgi:hypothetical protein